jgi:hypothetical protein
MFFYFKDLQLFNFLRFPNTTALAAAKLEL